MSRTFYGQPIRWTTEHHYPDPVSIQRFAKLMQIEGHPFIQNLANDTRERFVEEWAETFMNWSEVEQVVHGETPVRMSNG